MKNHPREKLCRSRARAASHLLQHRHDQSGHQRRHQTGQAQPPPSGSPAHCADAPQDQGERNTQNQIAVVADELRSLRRRFISIRADFSQQRHVRIISNSNQDKTCGRRQQNNPEPRPETTPTTAPDQGNLAQPARTRGAQSARVAALISHHAKGYFKQMSHSRAGQADARKRFARSNTLRVRGLLCHASGCRLTIYTGF